MWCVGGVGVSHRWWMVVVLISAQQLALELVVLLVGWVREGSQKNGQNMVFALVTKDFTLWRCPQFCAQDIVVCQAKLNDCITYLVSMYMDQNIQDFPKEYKE